MFLDNGAEQTQDENNGQIIDALKSEIKLHKNLLITFGAVMIVFPIVHYGRKIIMFVKLVKRLFKKSKNFRPQFADISMTVIKRPADDQPVVKEEDDDKDKILENETEKPLIPEPVTENQPAIKKTEEQIG